MSSNSTKLSDYHLGCVEWLDAYMSMDEFSAEDLERASKPEPVRSFGLIVRSDDAGVTLATDEGPNDKKFRKIIFIPRAMVSEVIDLGIPKRRRASSARAPRGSRRSTHTDTPDTSASPRDASGT